MINRKRFFLLCLFLFIIFFFFPKESGRGGNVPLSEMTTCRCYGFQRTVNEDQKNIFVSICYGVVGTCHAYLDCEDERCWHKTTGCKCPGLEFWTKANGACLAKDGMGNCICTHNECDGLQAIGG